MKEKLLHLIARYLFYGSSFLAAPIGVWYIVVYCGGDTSLAWLLATPLFFIIPLSFGRILEREKQKIEQAIESNFSKIIPLFDSDGQQILADCRSEIERKVERDFFK